jgi:uncharacterized protein (DUF1810 family)
VQDPYRLDRFTQAQDQDGIYQRAVAELRAGRKASHWMWFVFPQLADLGLSAMSREFAVSSLDEAQAYLRHPVLGPRLIECATIVADTEGKNAEDIFGSVDAMKLRSSMTLFMAAAPGKMVFMRVLVKYFDGAPDGATMVQLMLSRRQVLAMCPGGGRAVPGSRRQPGMRPRHPGEQGATRSRRPTSAPGRHTRPRRRASQSDHHARNGRCVPPFPAPAPPRRAGRRTGPGRRVPPPR